MKFSDFVCRDAVIVGLQATSKSDVIREMTRALVAAGAVQEADFEGILQAVAKREELGSTGIGRGVAIPHAKHKNVAKQVGTVAVSHEGVNFESLDGEKVHLFVLLISHPDRPSDHLRALENVSTQLRNDTFCRFLKQAQTADDVLQLLDEADQNQFG